jgi:hypothetical protein
MKIEYDLIFISLILIIVLICIFMNKSKNNEIEPFLMGNFMQAIRKKSKKSQIKCPDCNCPSLNISKTVSSDIQLQKLFDVYVQEGLENMLKKDSYAIDIQDDEVANEYLKEIDSELKTIVDLLSNYSHTTSYKISALHPFINGQSKPNGNEGQVVCRKGAVSTEIGRVYSRIKLLKTILKNLGFLYTEFLSGNDIFCPAPP